jgi:hypothetical protein
VLGTELPTADWLGWVVATSSKPPVRIAIVLALGGLYSWAFAAGRPRLVVATALSLIWIVALGAIDVLRARWTPSVDILGVALATALVLRRDR